MNAYLMDTRQQTHAPLSSALVARLREVAETQGERALRRELRHAFPGASAPQLRRLRELITLPSTEFPDIVDAQHWGLVVSIDPAGIAIVKLDTMLGEPTKFILRSETSSMGWTLLEERAPGVFDATRQPSQFPDLDQAAGAFFEQDPSYKEMARQRAQRDNRRTTSSPSS